MNAAELNSGIGEVIRAVVNNPALEVNPDSKLMDDLGLESIDLLDVSSELENTIGVEVDFKDVVMFIRTQDASADMKTLRVQDLVNYLQATKLA